MDKAKLSEVNRSSEPDVRTKISEAKKGKPWSFARRAAHEARKKNDISN